jgi:hypothetical protein
MMAGVRPTFVGILGASLLYLNRQNCEELKDIEIPAQSCGMTRCTSPMLRVRITVNQPDVFVETPT